jgi:hypothetical protein
MATITRIIFPIFLIDILPGERERTALRNLSLCNAGRRLAKGPVPLRKIKPLYRVHHIMNTPGAFS